MADRQRLVVEITEQTHRELEELSELLGRHKWRVVTDLIHESYERERKRAAAQKVAADLLKDPRVEL